MKKMGVVLSFLLLSWSTFALGQQRHSSISFVERIADQKAIEEVYWKHTIWPADNPQPKPALKDVMSDFDIRFKTEEYLKKSNALASYWHYPISADRLQAEIDRMARETRDPEILKELFAALGNDPYLIAECLARPILVDRFADQIPSFDEWWAAERERTEMPAAFPSHQYRLPQARITSSDPAAVLADSWNATTTTGAPSARQRHSVVWTGTLMIVWGGRTLSGNFLRTGGRYNPATNSWSATKTIGAPSARGFQTAVWTGTQMITWGGLGGSDARLNTGGRYNPATNTWAATTKTAAPAARYFHTAIWTGTEMIVWGGISASDVNLQSGGRYNPGANSWTDTSVTGAPAGRFAHAAIWTGKQMIVWGGYATTPLKTGGRYTPATNKWTPTKTTGAPAPRDSLSAVWTGTQMIIWGGEKGSPNAGLFKTGGRYNPATNSWRATTTIGAPSPRFRHTAIWTGTQMIIWGGYDGSAEDTGGRYNPASNSWTSTTTTSAPSDRYGHTAVWTGTEMIVWGGSTGTALLKNGGRYNP